MLIKSKTRDKPANENAFPKPKKVRCFKCKENIFVKFVIPRQEYSQKNNWDYWTRENKKKNICDKCLLDLYYDKPLYWKTVKDLGKRQQIRSYIYHGIISA